MQLHANLGCVPIQDIALVERSAATFDSALQAADGGAGDEAEPAHCVLLRAGGHMSVLDMEQGEPSRLSVNRKTNVLVVWGGIVNDMDSAGLPTRPHQPECAGPHMLWSHSGT